jgi:hypothetical protein
MAKDKYEEKERFDGKKVKILIPTYGPSPDEDRYSWRNNINGVGMSEEADPVMGYLKSAERYFSSDPKEWFGSEKRKNPA